jgi:hypothetical protein
MKLWQVALLAMVFGFLLLADPPQVGDHPSFEAFQKLRDAAAPPGPTAAAMPAVTVCTGFEAPVRNECLAAYAAYFRYQASVFKQRQAVFDFQLLSTKLILFMVMLLVMAGLTFAALQFWHTFKTPVIQFQSATATPKAAATDSPDKPIPPTATPPAGIVAEQQVPPTISPTGLSSDKQSPAAPTPPTPQPSGMPDLASDLEVSLTGFKVKSSVIGLLLILVSMCFFFLYLRYVYPK